MSTRRAHAPPKRDWEIELTDLEHVRRAGVALHFLALRWNDALLFDSERAHGLGGVIPGDSGSAGGGGGLGSLSPFFSASVECRGEEDAAELESLVMMAREWAPPRLRHISNGVLVVSPMEIVEPE